MSIVDRGKFCFAALTKQNFFSFAQADGWKAIPLSIFSMSGTLFIYFLEYIFFLIPLTWHFFTTPRFPPNWSNPLSGCKCIMSLSHCYLCGFSIWNDYGSLSLPGNVRLNIRSMPDRSCHVKTHHPSSSPTRQASRRHYLCSCRPSRRARNRLRLYWPVSQGSPSINSNSALQFPHTWSPLFLVIWRVVKSVPGALSGASQRWWTLLLGNLRYVRLL